MIAAVLLGFDLKDAASIGIIGAADGPTSILVSQVLHSNYIGPIAVAAYSYMALVPIIQPFAIKLVTTKKERAMHMPYNPKHVSRSLRICFPIMVTIIAGFIGCFELASVLSKSKPNTLALEQTLSKSSSDHERTTICRASLVDECSQPMNQS